MNNASHRKLLNIESQEDFINGSPDTISESLQFHVENEIPITENVFRAGSKAFFSIIREARVHYDEGLIDLCNIDKKIFETTDIGRFSTFNGVVVPLDLPMDIDHDISYLYESEYQGKKVKLNYPMRGGTKKYYVYVMNPKTKKVKKISFGDVHGGLKAKVADPEARRNFAARHRCDTKKDKTKAGYWACRINRYGHLWGGKTYSGYW